MSQAQVEELTSVKVRRYYQRTLSPGEVVFDEGDPSDQLYVIQAGEVELVRETAGQGARGGAARTRGLLRRARRSSRASGAARARSPSTRRG